MEANRYQFTEQISEYRYKGDLYLQQEEYEKAGGAYIEFLKRIERHPELFRNFAVFWETLKRRASHEALTAIENRLKEEFNHNEFPEAVCGQLAELFVGESARFEILSRMGERSSVSQVKRWIESRERKGNRWDVYLLLFQTVSNEHSPSTARADKYMVSVMERYGLYAQAIRLISIVLLHDQDDVAARTLFRLCRKISDYADAEAYMRRHPEFLDRSDFNIQYELVYYYDFLKDDDGLRRTLNRMKSSAEGNIPISRTLYNFYIRYGMIDEAARQRTHTEKLIETRRKNSAQQEKGEEQEKETEEAVWMKIKDLISEQEHNRQLLAMRELLKGFSHELGQPITNIRYAVQLHQMKMETMEVSREETEVLLDSVLKQTVRIRQLLNRFSPIVSSKSAISTFFVRDRIENILDELESRLKAGNVKVEVKAEETFALRGDPVQFDQVFYNLIANSIEAMKDQETGKIWIIIRNIGKREIQIQFSDNGPGVPENIRKKIFEPFFSTKDRQKGEGGEGLGLFIVWNILKMYGGKIRIAPPEKRGAEFFIRIPAGKEDGHEQDSDR